MLSFYFYYFLKNAQQIKLKQQCGAFVFYFQFQQLKRIKKKQAIKSKVDPISRDYIIVIAICCFNLFVCLYVCVFFRGENSNCFISKHVAQKNKWKIGRFSTN